MAIYDKIKEEYTMVILCLDLDPEKLLPGTHETYIRILSKEKKDSLMVALFLIAKDWKPIECPPRKEIINCSMITHEPELNILTEESHYYNI